MRSLQSAQPPGLQDLLLWGSVLLELWSQVGPGGGREDRDLRSECFRFITRERRCWSCPCVSVVTHHLEKDTELREQIKLWTNQNTADQSRPVQTAGEELQLPEPVPLLTNTDERDKEQAGPLTSGGRVDGAGSQLPAVTKTEEVDEQTINGPCKDVEAAELVSEVNETIPKDLVEEIAEVNEDIPKIISNPLRSCSSDHTETRPVA